MLDIQIIKDNKKQYFRNNIHLEQVTDFFREVYLKLPDPDEINIQIFDLHEMPVDDVCEKTYWEALDKLASIYAEIEKENIKYLKEEKIHADCKEGHIT